MKKLLIWTVLLGCVDQGYIQGSGDSYNDVATLNQTGKCTGNCDLMNLQASELKSGLKITDLSGANLENANLSGLDLSGALLVNTDFTGAVLSGCNLTGAHMSGANFSGASLNGVIANGADFTNTSLYQADMSTSKFQQANFTGAGFGGANISGCDFTGATLMNLETTMDQDKTFTNSKGQAVTIPQASYLDLRNSNLMSVNFSNAKLSGINLSNSILNGVNFSGATLDANADLSNVNNPQVLSTMTGVTLTTPAIILNNANLQSANLTNLNIKNSQFNGTDFTNANLSNVDLSGVYLPDLNIKLTGANFSGANLTGDNLVGQDLTGVNFTDANLTSTGFGNLKSVNFTNANLTGATFTSGTIDSSIFDGANLSKATFVVMNFTSTTANSSFQNVTLDGSCGFIANSSGVNAAGTKLPSQNIYSIKPTYVCGGDKATGGAIQNLPDQTALATFVNKPVNSVNLNIAIGNPSKCYGTGANMTCSPNTQKTYARAFNPLALWSSGCDQNSFGQTMIAANNLATGLTDNQIKTPASCGFLAPGCLTPTMLFNLANTVGLLSCTQMPT